MARHMVCEWGMEDKIGPIAYGHEEEPIFLAREIARHKDYSEETAKLIDEAVKKILDAAREKAWDIILAHKQKLEKLSEALMLRETLVDEEVRSLLGLAPRENTLSLLNPSPAGSSASSGA
jgi:cell division protease FtsH